MRTIIAAGLIGSAVLLAAGAARADVMYTFYDAATPTQVDLSFNVATQLATTGQTETMTNIGGDFPGSQSATMRSNPRFPSRQVWRFLAWES